MPVVMLMYLGMYEISNHPGMAKHSKLEALRHAYRCPWGEGYQIYTARKYEVWC